MPAVPGKPAATPGVATRKSSRLGFAAALAGALAMLLLSACASDDSPRETTSPDSQASAATTSAASATPTSGATPSAVPDATPTPEPTSTPVPMPVSQDGEWNLVFGDEFDTIDRSKWETGWFSSTGFSPSVNQTGAACYHPDQLSTADGTLVITVQAETNGDCRLKDGRQGDYVAGLMNTRESFTFTYGYAEARMFLASDSDGLLNWPAFWHTGFDWPVTGEIDIAEGLSGGELCSVYHHEGSDGEPAQERGCADWDEPGGWHVFAAEWEPDRITFFYDGDQVFTTTTGVVGAPHYLVINYTVRNDGSAHVPSEMLVDYIRVWETSD